MYFISSVLRIPEYTLIVESHKKFLDTFQATEVFHLLSITLALEILSSESSLQNNS